MFKTGDLVKIVECHDPDFIVLKQLIGKICIVDVVYPDCAIVKYGNDKYCLVYNDEMEKI